MLIAHIREMDYTEQTVTEHLSGVAALARRYGTPSHVGALAELAGFLHDMGKFTEHFTVYLRNAVLKHEVAAQKIDHSTAGAKYLYERFYGQDPLQNLVVETVGMAILSHHSGMQNFVQPDLKPSDYLRRVQNDELPFYEEVVRNFEQQDGYRVKVNVLLEEAKLEMQRFLNLAHIDPLSSLSLYQKLVFSCLIDADRTNTRCFEEGVEEPVSVYQPLFERAYNTFMKKVADWKGSDNPLNQLRTQMSDACETLAEKPSTIRTLSIPTGGGKTFASLRYALKHALEQEKSNIIYIVPYTTILEQNAREVREIIQQSDAVLEHHANVMDSADQDEEPDLYRKAELKKMQLGRDNWDHPIIFTTMVQFLDAIYQKGTRKSRRLHNLTNAVLIFDEVQSVPYEHHSLFNAALDFLQRVGNSAIILCTATQPAVDRLKPPLVLEKRAEMVPDLARTVEAFKRVSITSLVENEAWDAERIGEFTRELLDDNDSVLIILNTKAAVRAVYQYVQENLEVEVVHLSTSMCPAHRKESLDAIRTKLGSQKLVCVSTQLIEAGVDIDFSSVIRSLAGLDSIAQAAGRCNRHAKREEGDVYIIRAQEGSLSNLPEIRIGGEVTANYILSIPEFADNMLSPDAIREYFSHFIRHAESQIKVAPEQLGMPLYSLLNGTAPSQRKTKTLSSSMWKTIERHFEAIHSPTKAVIVPYGHQGKGLIADLNEPYIDLPTFQKLMTQAQQYSVNLYAHEVELLNRNGMIAPLFDGSVLCLKEGGYDELYGVSYTGDAAVQSGIYL